MEALLQTFSNREKLQPLCELNHNDLEYVFEQSAVKVLAPRTLITPDEQILTYLIEGEISLLAGGFVVEKFSHTDKRALQPLFDESCDEDAALLTSHGSILEIDRKLFEGLYAQSQVSQAEPDELDLQRQSRLLFDELRRAFDNNQLQLPALPQAALKIRRLVNQPDVGSDEIIQVVQTDPILSARIIKAANSALYGTWREIKTVRDAVRRLGLETTRSLSFSLSVKQLFHARSSLVKEKIEQMYDESIHVSAIAYVITQNRTRHLDPEQSLLAGLLHKLGSLPMLKYLDENPGLITSAQVLNQNLQELNLPMSRLIFEHWHFDAQFLKVVESADDWSRDTGQRADYVDVIIAARLFYLRQSNQLDESVNIETLPVAEKLNLFEVDESGLDFFEQVEQEIKDMEKVLGA